MKKIMQPRVLASIGTVLVLSLLVTSLWLHDSNKGLKLGLNSEKLKSETLLSEKLAIEKDIAKARQQIEDLKGRNTDLDTKLNTLLVTLEEKSTEVKRLNVSNRKLKSTSKQLAELQQIREDLNAQMAGLQQTISNLTAENEILRETTAALQRDKSALEQELQLVALMSASDYRIEALRTKKDKLTVKAGRTQRLKIGFEMPQEIATNIQFKVTTPDGAIFNSRDNATSFTLEENDEEPILYASISPAGSEMFVSKRMQLTFKPEQKLKSGVYKVAILNGDRFIGSCEVRLK